MTTPSHGMTDPVGHTRTLVVGAGKIGIAIAGLLASAPEYDVTVLDRSERVLRIADNLGVRTVQGRRLRRDPARPTGWPQ